MIVDSIEQKLNFLVEDSPNALHAWSALSRRFDRTDHLLVEAIKAEMGKCRLVCVCDVEVHLERLEALFVKLKRAGLKLDVKKECSLPENAATRVKMIPRHVRTMSRSSTCLTLQHDGGAANETRGIAAVAADQNRLFVICATRAGIVSWIVH